MSYIQNVYPIQSRDAIARDVFDYVVACPDIASQSHAGQFVHIRVAGHTLRRPISICEVNREKGTLRLVFEVRGSGTEAMSMLSVGDLMDGSAGQWIHTAVPGFPGDCSRRRYRYPAHAGNCQALRGKLYRDPGLPGCGPCDPGRRF